MSRGAPTADKALQFAEASPRAIRCYFDGSCEPENPGGTAGFGAVILQGTARLFEVSGMVPASPTTSNNVAEYLAVLAILEWLEANRPAESAYVFGDSRLVICQLWGWPVLGRKLWKINGIDTKNKPAGFYAPHAVKARETLKRLPNVLGFWIPRDKNSIADDLSKAELRRAGVEFRIQPEEETDE